jgi:large subunit ribosomal protein L15
MTKLSKTNTKSKKRVGRGYGSGRGGHTSGRGMKGQRARRSIGVLFEGVKMKKSFVKRLPLMRGKGKFSASKKPIVIKLDYLNILPTGSIVNIETLVKYGIVKLDDAQKVGVKILGGGELKNKLTIELPISKSAAKQVEKVKGKVVSKQFSKKD